MQYYCIVLPVFLSTAAKLCG